MGSEVADIDATVRELRDRGVLFEEYDFPGIRTEDGIADIKGNYPSKGGIGERAVRFRDSGETSSASARRSPSPPNPSILEIVGHPEPVARSPTVDARR